MLAVLPLSGPGADQGKAKLAGLKAAASVLNANGGILGHKVDVTSEDDQGDPSLAITKIQSAIRGTKPDLVMAGASSNETDALAPVLNRAKVLNIQVTDDPKIDDGTKTPYTFCSTPGIPSIIGALVTHVSSLNASKVGFVYADDALGSATGEFEVGALKKAGVDVVSASYPADALDDSATLLKVKAANPDVLIVEGYGTQVGHLFASRAKIGWNLPTIGDAAVSSSGLAELVPASALQNVKLMTFTINQYKPFAQQTPAVQAFIKATATQGPITQPINATSFAYDALMVADQAAVQANSIKTDDVKNALENLKQSANSRVVSFSTFFTPQSHVIEAGASDFSFVPASKVTSGFFGVPAGTPASDITG